MENDMMDFGVPKFTFVPAPFRMEHSTETICCWEAQKYQKPTHVKDSAYTPPSRSSGNEKEKDEKATDFFSSVFFPISNHWVD